MKLGIKDTLLNAWLLYKHLFFYRFNDIMPTVATGNTISSLALTSLRSGKYIDECFQQFTNGENGVVCALNLEGVSPASHCSGYTRTDSAGGSGDTIGMLCRAACTISAGKGHQICLDAGEKYCSAFSSNADCACLTPGTATVWRTPGTGNGMKWTELEQTMTNNVGLESTAPKCFWPACFASATASGYVIPSSESLQSPHTCPSMASIKCLIENVDVTLNDVTAKNISIMNQKCGATGLSGNQTSSLGEKFDDMSPEKQFLLVGGIALGGIVVLGIIVLILVTIYKNHTDGTRFNVLKKAADSTHLPAVPAQVQQLPAVAAPIHQLPAVAAPVQQLPAVAAPIHQLPAVTA